MTTDPTISQAVLLEEIDRRQDQLLEELDQLNKQVVALLEQCSGKKTTLEDESDTGQKRDDAGQQDVAVVSKAQQSEAKPNETSKKAA